MLKIRMDVIRVLCLLTCVLPLSAIYIELQRHFDIEDVLTENQTDYWVWRSEASNLKTLRLVDPGDKYKVEVYICPKPVADAEIVVINLDDLRYANDGPWDSIHVTLNGEPWAEYLTFEKWAWGHDWNIFRNTGHLGRTVYLPRGRHVIGIAVQTDQWGIELDKLRINAEYHDLNEPLFCGGKLVVR